MIIIDHNFYSVITAADSVIITLPFLEYCYGAMHPIKLL